MLKGERVKLFEAPFTYFLSWKINLGVFEILSEN